MRFCDKCHSYMQKTASGLACSRCGYTIQTDIVDVENIEGGEEKPVDVIGASQGAERTKVEEVCPDRVLIRKPSATFHSSQENMLESDRKGQ